MAVEIKRDLIFAQFIHSSLKILKVLSILSVIKNCGLIRITFLFNDFRKVKSFSNCLNSSSWEGSMKTN